MAAIVEEGIWVTSCGARQYCEGGRQGRKEKEGKMEDFEGKDGKVVEREGGSGQRTKECDEGECKEEREKNKARL